MISQGMTLVNIGQMMDLSEPTILSLKNDDENQWGRLTEEQKESIIELAHAGLSTIAISTTLSVSRYLVSDTLKNEYLLTYMKSSKRGVMREFTIHETTLNKLLKEEGFRIPNSGVVKKLVQHNGGGTFPFYKPISDRLMDIIEGELLGDGHISLTRALIDKDITIESKEYEEALEIFKEINEAKNFEDIPIAVEKYNRLVEIIEKVKLTHFELHKSIKELEWPRFIGKLLNEDNYKTRMPKYVDNCYCISEASVQMQKLREKWYIGKTKILPERFKLNGTKLLGLYEGDGYFDRARNRINLSTLSFTKEENGRLSDLINKEAGIESIVTPIHKNGKEYFAINIYKTKDVDKFFEYLEEKADREALEMAKKVVPHKFK